MNKNIQLNDNHSTLYSTLEQFQPPSSSFFFYIRVFIEISFLFHMNFQNKI